MKGTSGRLGLGDQSPPKPDLLDTSVLAGGDVRDALRAVRHADAGLIDGLKLRGLVRSAWTRLTIGVASALPLAAVLGLGVWRAAIGVGRDKPIGYLVMMSTLWVAAGFVLLTTVGRRTGAGSKALRRERRRRPKKLHRRASTSGDWAWGAGLYGLRSLPSDARPLRDALTPQPSGGGGFFSGCGTSGSGSSGCGGGGCGGGAAAKIQPYLESNLLIAS